MKASPNREHLLFLVTGGIILILILVVVVFNMVRTPQDLSTEEEQASTPKVKVGDRSINPVKSSWLTQVAPAPIFNTEPNRLQPEPAKEIGLQDSTSTTTDLQPPEKPENPWNNKSGSSLEFERLNTPVISTEEIVAQQIKKPFTPPTAKLPPPKAPTAPEQQTTMPKKQKVVVAKPSITQEDQAVEESAANQDDNEEVAQHSASPAPKRINKTSTKSVTPDADSNRRESTSTSPKPIVKSAPKPPPEEKSGFSVQIASYNDDTHAEELVAKLARIMFNGRRMPTYKSTQWLHGKTLYRVHMGPFTDEKQAQRAANLVRKKTGMKGLISGSAK